MAYFTAMTSLGPALQGLCTLVNIPNVSCGSLSTPTTEVYNEFVRAEFENATNGIMTTPGSTIPLYSWMQQWRNVYYGNFRTNDLDASPAKARYRDRFTSRTKAKDFIAARNRGEIVFNPMTAVDVTLELRPGAYRKDVWLTGQSHVQLHNTSFDKRLSPVLEGCAARPSRTVPLLPNGKGYVTPSWVGARATYNWYGVSPANYALPVTVPQAQEMGSVIAHNILFESEIDHCLTTSVIAQGRAGAVDVLTAFAEAPETIMSIWSACEHILRYYLEVRGKVKRLEGITDPGAITAIRDLWLQYRYGIMPNVYLIQDALAYLERVKPSYQTERQGERHVTSGFDFANGWVVPDAEVVHRCLFKQGFKVGFDTDSLQKWGPSTVWELIPLSFVVDWVVNVGDYLTALRPVSDVQHEGVTYSFRTNDSFELSHPDWFGQPISCSLDVYRLMVIDVNEIGISASPQLNWKRWLDAAALSWTGFRRLYRQSLRSIR